MTNDTNTCTCKFCADTHAEFIFQFGRFPTMSHDDAIALADRRRKNAESFDRIMRRR